MKKSLGAIWPFILLVIIIAVLLACPVAREVAYIEASALWPGAKWQGLYPLDEPMSGAVLPGLDIDALAIEEADAHTSDWETVLGAGLLAADPQVRLELAARAADLSPKNPVVLSALASMQLTQLQWSRVEALGPTAKIPDDFEEVFLSEEAARPARQTLERLRLADLENGKPEALLAWLDFGEGRDDTALARLRVAANAPRFDFYYSEQAGAVAKTLRAAGLPDFESEHVAIQRVYFRELALLRETARVTGSLAMEAKAAGEDEKALAAWQATIALGRTMRRTADTAIGSLVGIAIEAIGAAPVYKWMRLEVAEDKGAIPAAAIVNPEGRYQGGDIFHGEEHDYFVVHAGEEAADDVLAGLEEAMSMKEDWRGFAEEALHSEGELFWRPLANMIGGCFMLSLFFVAAAGTALGLVVSAGRGVGTFFGRQWKGLVGLIIVFAGLFYVAGYLLTAGQHYDPFHATSLVPGQFGEALPVNRNVLLLPLAIILLGGAYLLKNAMAETPGWSRWFAALGALGVVVSVALGLAYTVTAFQAASLRAQGAAWMQAQRTGALMRQFKEEYPRYFKSEITAASARFDEAGED